MTTRKLPPKDGSGSLSYNIKQPPEPNSPDSHMQTPKQTATTQERQQGTDPIAVLFQQQSGPPSIQMAPRELTEPAQFYSVLVYAFLVSVD